MYKILNEKKKSKLYIKKFNYLISLFFFNLTYVNKTKKMSSLAMRIGFVQNALGDGVPEIVGMILSLYI